MPSAELEELFKQQSQFMRQQSELLTAVMARLANPAEQPVEAVLNPQLAVEKTMESLSRNMNEFSYDPDNGITFDSWYKRYADWFEEDAKHLNDGAKVRLLVRKLDAVSHARYTNYILPNEPRDITFDETKKILTTIFDHQLSLFNARYNVLKIQKKSSDDYVTYAGIVNKQCERFKLGDLTNDQFKCLIFVCGLSSNTETDIRTRLLSKIETDPEVTLKSLTTEANRLVSLKKDTKMIESQSPAVQFIKKNSNEFQKKANTKPTRNCWYCGDLHFVRFCKYKEHKCKQCNVVGHKEGFCTSSKPKTNNDGKPKNPQHQNFTKQKSNSIFMVSRIDFENRRKFIKMKVNDVSVKLQIDTGSDISIISESTWRTIGKPELKQTTHSARNASGEIFELSSELNCSIEFNGTQTTGTCYISTANLDIIGIDWIEKFSLWDVPINSICNQIQSHSRNPSIQQSQTKFVENLKQDFSDVFETTLGLCTKTTAVLHLKPGATPVFRPKRPVSYAALSDVEQELQRLEEKGVITKIDFSAWAAPIVVTKKSNGSIRICADFSTGLNDVLESHQYPLPVPEEIFATLAGGQYFSKIDLADAYLQIQVDEASRSLLAINTHKGLYQYNRLCFGIKSAPGIFQQTMDTMLAGCVGAVSYLDDLIVVSKTEDEHRKSLTNVFRRLREWGFHVKAEKCGIFLQRISYLGFIIDREGRRPDPEKIVAIQQMPPPTDVTTLRSFIGMISYYGQFVRQMRELRAPLDQLLKKETKWNWSTECQQAFEKAKEILKSNLLLTHFDPQFEVKVAADASSYGLGAVILHKYPDGSEKAIAHAARALLPAEKNYSQIEKEGLGLIFAVTKFHRYLYGRKFTLSTDHKPLLAIFGSKKGIPAHTANRLQRWALTLLAYDFKIEHIGTTNFGHADALSRLMKQTPQSNEDSIIATISMVDAEVNQIVLDNVRQLPVTAKMIVESTANDALLKDVSTFLRTSWPSVIEDPQLKLLYNRRESLSESNGCILMSERIIIPLVLQAAVLKQLHLSHPGIVRMKALARSHVYWPNIDKQIEELVRNCSRCASAAKMPTKTNLASWPIPKKPWERVHIDYAGPFQGHNFLLIVDAYSKWPEIFIMAQTTATATVAKIEELFARFGIPEILVSDNGTQFTSQMFADFCTNSGITHIRTPPYHPQSNGQAERFVDTFKRALSKTKGEEVTTSSLQTFLRCYRTTPNTSLPQSMTPAQVMFGRQIRTTLDLMHPKNVTFPIQRNSNMEKQFNRHHGTVTRTFQPNEKVFVTSYTKNKRTWVPATIIENQGSVIYKVRVGKNIWSRHANQIRSRHSDETTDASLQLPFDILMDTFELNTLLNISPQVSANNTPLNISPQISANNSFEEVDMNSTEEELFVDAEQSPVITRYPIRERAPPKRLQIEPISSRYTSF